MTQSAPQHPAVSVVVPVVERHDDLRQIFDSFTEVLRRDGRSCEFIFVVDGGQREVLPELRRLRDAHPAEVKVLVLGKTFGESAALTVGLESAKGDLILTVASYFQVEPEDVRRMFEPIETGDADIVIGRRHPRIDSPFNRLQSSVFHWMVRRLTSTEFHDISCGVRLMKRGVAEELSLYGDLHRFIPILAISRGFRVREESLRQRAEDRATRYHGAGVYLRRVLDILTVFFLIKFTRKPLRFFGLIGTGLFVVGLVITAYLAADRLIFQGSIGDRPLLLLGVLLMVLGVQSVSIGLLGEIIIFTHARNVKEYQIAEIL
jgi:glycosyltransferase involved in cell wall biosynthesis